MNNQSSYEVKVFCNNCESETTISLTKGVSISEGLKDKECPNCGCKMLKKAEKKDIFKDFKKKAPWTMENTL